MGFLRWDYRNWGRISGTNSYLNATASAVTFKFYRTLLGIVKAHIAMMGGLPIFSENRQALRCMSPLEKVKQIHRRRSEPDKEGLLLYRRR
jgi:chorismate synthase